MKIECGIELSIEGKTGVSVDWHSAGTDKLGSHPHSNTKPLICVFPCPEEPDLRQITLTPTLIRMGDLFEVVANKTGMDAITAAKTVLDTENYTCSQRRDNRCPRKHFLIERKSISIDDPSSNKE